MADGGWRMADHRARERRRHRLLSDNSPQLPAVRPEESLHRPLDLLFHAALVQRAQPGRHVVAFLEVLRIRGTPFDGPQVTDAAERDGAQRVGRLEFPWRTPARGAA